jgi:hypothetical protein
MGLEEELLGVFLSLSLASGVNNSCSMGALAFIGAKPFFGVTIW